MTKNGIVFCKCGAPARPRQRNCRACKNASTKRSVLKRKLSVQRLEQALHHLTIDNPATRREYESQFRTRAVAICDQDGMPAIAGFVVGFLPDLMLKVMDDYGKSHFVRLDRVVEDLGRAVDGEILHVE